MDSKRIKTKSLLHDLNIFIPLLSVVTFIILAPLTDFVTNVSWQLLNYQLTDELSISLAFVLEMAALIYFWKTLELSPLPIIGKERDWRWGHSCLAIGNVMFMVPVLTVIFLVLASGKSENGLYMYWAIPFIGIALILWVVGGSRISKSAKWEMPHR